MIATVAELASYLQRDFPAEDPAQPASSKDAATAQLLLDLAEGLIVSAVGVQTPWPPVARAVQLEAAARAFRNPQALRAETVGAVSASYDPSTVGVYLTDAEKARLVPSVGGSNGVFLVSLARDPE